jgi:adenylylsulfate kinase
MSEPISPSKSSNVSWQHALVTREDKQHLNGHRSVVIWFTGLSGAGKSTLANAVEKKLYQLLCRTFVLDGDNVRHGLCGDLGFAEADRQENIRRIGETAKLFAEAGVITLTAFISPYRADRRRVRALFAPGDFVEVYCRCDLEVCEGRDVKGMYRKARLGEIRDFTGVSAPYEEPENAELVVETGRLPLDECVSQVVQYLQGHGVLTVS